VVTPAGDIYITGTSDVNFTSYITTVKLNTSGFLQWSKIYSGGGPSDGATDITLDKQGNITVLGGSQINNTLSIALLIRYNSNGDTLWVRKFNQLGQHYSIAYKGVVDDSGNVYSIGSFEPDNFHSNYLTLKYSQNGNLVWYTIYDSPQHEDIGDYIALDTNRNVYVVGTTSIPGSLLNNTLLKLTNGVIQWTRTFNGIININGECQFPAGIAVTPDGNAIYYTTFCSNGSGGGGYDIVTLKYNGITGDSVWVRSYGGELRGHPMNQGL
jgi:hypothetical protein